MAELPAAVSYSGLTLQQWQLLRREFSLMRLWERCSTEERTVIAREIVLLIQRHALTPALRSTRAVASKIGQARFYERYGQNGHAEFARLYNSADYRHANKGQREKLRATLREQLRPQS